MKQYIATSIEEQSESGETDRELLAHLKNCSVQVTRVISLVKVIRCY